MQEVAGPDMEQYFREFVNFGSHKLHMSFTITENQTRKAKPKETLRIMQRLNMSQRMESLIHITLLFIQLSYQ